MRVFVVGKEFVCCSGRDSRASGLNEYENENEKPLHGTYIVYLGRVRRWWPCDNGVSLALRH